jgi:acyl-CoA dehydrogenase
MDAATMLSTSLVNSVELDDELVTMAAALRGTLANFDESYWARCDVEHRYPAEYVASMAEGGWLGMTIPEEFGGAGRSHVATAVALHEIAASGAGLAGCIPIHMALFTTAPLVRYGSSQLKRNVLPKICSGETVLCFAVTEMNSGNDMSTIMTRARQVGGGWVISGHKTWVTQASKANAAILLARTRAAGAVRTGGLSLFFVPLDRKGVQRIPMRKNVLNAIESSEVQFDELAIPNEYLIGHEGQGFEHILSALNSERVLAAAEGVGLGRVALHRAVDYANERESLGHPISSYQAISHPLARASAMLSGAWLATLNGANQIDRGLEAGAAANEAMFLSSDACYRAADAAMQTFGGMAFSADHGIERYYREARLFRVGPVSQEMTLNYLARSVLGLTRSY